MLVTSNGTDNEIDIKHVRRYLGYSADYKPPARILSLTGEYVEHARRLIEPAYSHTIKNIERVEGSIVFSSQRGKEIIANHNYSLPAAIREQVLLEIASMED